MDVIAEGIEKIEELYRLKEKNCYKVQGYLYSKPVNINEMEIYLQNFDENIIL